jgi:hypothetical protein
MKAPRGWGKPSKKGSVYYNFSDRGVWIVKMKNAWALVQQSNQAAGREQEVFGKFSTLTAAAAHYEGTKKCTDLS